MGESTLFGGAINYRQLFTWLAGIAIVAGIGAGMTAYSASGTAGEAKVMAEGCCSKNHDQDLKIQAVELEQKHIRITVDSNASKLDAILQRLSIPPPE